MNRADAFDRITKIEKQLEVEKHYAKGGHVESMQKSDDTKKWNLCHSPSFDWNYFNYRIASPPTHRPFGKGDRLIGLSVRKKGTEYPQYLITSQDVSEKWIHYKFGTMTLNNEELFDLCEISTDSGYTWGIAGVPLETAAVTAPTAEQPS